MKKFIIDGKEIVLSNPEAYERRLKELDDTYHTRIFNEDQVVVEKIKNPHYRSGQYYFFIRTCNGVPPRKHTN